MAFVQTRGAGLILDGAPYYFAGGNTYYLTYKSHFMVDAVLDGAKSLGLRVIRTWAFLDMGSIDHEVLSVCPPGPKEGVYFQYWDTVTSAPAYNDGPTGLEHLDYALYAAGQRGLKVILPLINNWRDFGGIDQYVVWFELGSHNSFFTDVRSRQAYKNWIAHLLNRVNIYTGMRYADDPAILAWELANECRCPGDPASLLNWVAEMSVIRQGTRPEPHRYCRG